MTAAKARRLTPVEDPPTWSEALAFACEVKARELSKALAELDNAAAILDDREQVATSIRQTSALLRSEVRELESEAGRLRTLGAV